MSMHKFSIQSSFCILENETHTETPKPNSSACATPTPEKMMKLYIILDTAEDYNEHDFTVFVVFICFLFLNLGSNLSGNKQKLIKFAKDFLFFLDLDYEKNTKILEMGF